MGSKVMFDGGMLDVTAPEALQVLISDDGTTIWVNDAEKCLFRACRIGELVVEDLRDSDEDD